MARVRANDGLDLSYRWREPELQLTVARASCPSITPSLTRRCAIVRVGSMHCAAGSAPLCSVLMKSADVDALSIAPLSRQDWTSL